MEITKELKENIRTAMLSGRENFGGSDIAYARSLGIDGSVYNKIENGEIEKVISTGQWLNIGRKFQVSTYKSEWKAAITEVYIEMEDNFNFCQQNQTSMILVDDCGIGKTFCAKIIISKMKNAFYLDASQSQTKIRLIRQLATVLGCDTTGKYYDVLENVKYAINILENPFICIDEAGDLEYNAYLELKGIINATEGNCAWFMIGADGLRSKITKGINNHKVGFAEIFSRFSDDFVTLVPRNPEERKEFYVKLFGDVAFVNLENKKEVNQIVKRCMVKVDSPYKSTQGQQDGRIKSLRYLKTIVKVRK
ncbi:AAA family ATPase [Chryseobacterium soli]|uniref:AAA family ATPase n=1 Tax=Chryseobacterium soli TaxID=445961 RepID=UPI00054F6052|nr:AAA family ATPase [Chryseobacterium soli]